MIKFLRRAVILLFVFVLGVAGSSFLLNSETTDDRSDMNDPVFPEVMVDFDGNYANRMYGYAQPMQSDFTRDSVTPIDTSKELSFVIKARNKLHVLSSIHIGSGNYSCIVISCSLICLKR